MPHRPFGADQGYRPSGKQTSGRKSSATSPIWRLIACFLAAILLHSVIDNGTLLEHVYALAH
jgi:hypothetical protein